MTDSTKLRQFLNLVEGELIPNKTKTLKVELDPYALYRLLLRMPSPHNYVEPNGSGMKGLLTYMDDVSYEQAIDKFKKFGIPFEETDGKTNNMWDWEHNHEDTFAVSPYPANAATKNDTKVWKDSKPTAKSSPLAKGKKKKDKS